MKYTIGLTILQHQKQLQRIPMSDQPAIRKTDLLLYCSKQSEANQRPLANPLGLRLFLVMMYDQTNRLIQLQRHINKETDVLARKIQTVSILLHSHRSKNRSPDCYLGVHAMGPIFGVGSWGIHR